VIIAKISERQKYPKIDCDSARFTVATGETCPVASRCFSEDSVRRNPVKPPRLTLRRIVKKIIFSKNKKALSPIFASLIILAVVTVLFIPVFIWSTNMTSQTQDFWNLSGQIATERVVVEQVSLIGNQPIPNCTIWVRNIGKTAVSIDNVFISAGTDIHVYQKSKSELTTVNPLTGGSLVSVIQGDLIEVRIPNLRASNPTFNIVNGTAYTVKISTAQGVSDSCDIVVSWFT
jgi:hypothetical protein